MKKLLALVINTTLICSNEILAAGNAAPPPPPPPGGMPPPPPPGMAMPQKPKGKPAWKIALEKKEAAEKAAKPQEVANTMVVSTLPIADLTAIPAVIKILNVPFNKVWVAFDFDATLTEKSGEKTPAGGDVLHLRGGANAKKILHELKAQGVNFMILTAAVTTTVPNAFDPITKELEEFGILDIFDTPSNKPVESFPGGMIAKGHLTSAANKDKAFVLKKFLQLQGYSAHTPDNNPQLIIFVDDAGGNVLQIDTAFKNTVFPVNVVSMHLEPAPGKGGVAGGTDETSPSDRANILSNVTPLFRNLINTANYPKSKKTTKHEMSRLAGKGEAD